MEPEEVNLVSSGACGAFVHSLEDEFMGVCVCVCVCGVGVFGMCVVCVWLDDEVVCGCESVCGCDYRYTCVPILCPRGAISCC